MEIEKIDNLILNLKITVGQGGTKTKHRFLYHRSLLCGAEKFLMKMRIKIPSVVLNKVKK